MTYPLYRCSIDGKTEYLTKEEFYTARRFAKYPKYCVIGERAGTRFDDKPEPETEKERGQENE